MQRGEIWWAALPAPVGSGPGHRRPVLIIQSDEFNRSAIRTILVAVITSNTRLGAAPGNVALSRRTGKLSRESVVNVSQLLTVDRAVLTKSAGRVSPEIMRQIDAGLRLIMAL